MSVIQCVAIVIKELLSHSGLFLLIMSPESLGKRFFIYSYAPLQCHNYSWSTHNKCLAHKPLNTWTLPEKQALWSLWGSHHLPSLPLPLMLTSTFWKAVFHWFPSVSRENLPWWLRRSSIGLQCGRPGFNPWVLRIFWRRKWQSTPVFLLGKSHGWRSLVGYSPWHPQRVGHDWATSLTHSWRMRSNHWSPVPSRALWSKGRNPGSGWDYLDSS